MNLFNCKLRNKPSFIGVTQAWLCGSLDGIVVSNNKIIRPVEIKRPSWCAKIPIVNGANCKINHFTIEIGQVVIKKCSQYYTEC